MYVLIPISQIRNFKINWSSGRIEQEHIVYDSEGIFTHYRVKGRYFYKKGKLAIPFLQFMFLFSPLK